MKQILSLLTFLLVPGTLTLATAEEFDLESWKTGRGAAKTLKEWSKENPGPWRSYFKSDSTDCAKRWFVNLGPLGVNTLMHDRTWGIFPGCRESFPQSLSDELGLIWNAFEVVGVKSGSPAESRLKVGDLILGMDDQALMPAQHTFPEKAVSNKLVRGLEIHAGQMIDRAEGRGEISLNILRLPGEVRSKLQAGIRTWREVGILDVEGEAQLHMPLGSTSLLRIRTTKPRNRVQLTDLTLQGVDGQTFPLLTSGKRGGKPALGDLLEIPAGKWTVSGILTAKVPCRVVVEVADTPSLPEPLSRHLKTITLPLDQIGSFGSQFAPEGEKARTYAAMLAHRLAVQQDEDGSWHVGGYASRAFPTSICGLALLSTEDPAYDDAIRRAAYYVANHGAHDKWTYSNGAWLIFLGEYFLRTQDEGILPALRMQVRNIRRFVLSDYTAGHSFGRPGYGGSGWIGGGGMVACGLAVASKTPAVEPNDLVLLDRMLDRAQELAPHGRIPYGRSGKVKSHDAEPGQGGSCATGPYFSASLIRGGAELFTRNAVERYSAPPFGSAENGHATQTLHFVWGCLAAANASPEAHLANMETYLWKFTTLREFDGFINKNNYRTEYHNGDGVIGEPYWRTAGYLLVMNAHKRNLAITGHPDYRGETRRGPIVYHRDRATHNQVLRSWALVEATLGDAAPTSLSAAAARLRNLQPGPELGSDLREVLTTEAPRVAADLLKLQESPAGITRGQLAQLVLGHGLQASFNPSIDTLIGQAEAGADANKTSKAVKQEQKRAAKEITGKIANGEIDSLPHALTIRPVALIQRDPEALPTVQSIGGSLFPVGKLSIEVADPDEKLFKGPLTFHRDKNGAVSGDTRGSGDEAALFFLREFKLDARDELLVKVSYESAGLTISYTAPLEIPAPEARGYIPFLTRVPVTGSVLDDYSRSYSMRILLDTGRVIGCEQRNNPANYLLEGGTYRYLISPNTGGWAHDLRAVQELDATHRIARITSLSGGSADSLSDRDQKTGITVTGESEFVFKLGDATRVSSVYMSFGPGESRLSHRLDAMVDGEWVLMRNGSIDGLMPVIPATTSQVRFRFPKEAKGLLSEVRFITPPPARPETPRFSW